MPCVHTENIRQMIRAATSDEQQTLIMVQRLFLRRPHLHNAIRLPDHTALETLSEFVVRYIEQVPNCIEAIYNIAQEADILQQVAPLLKVAIDYFLQPLALTDNRGSLQGLMDEAYLAHRLLEEINDRFIGLCGAPLAPIDMTRSNLIVHALIGEPFANELDQAVLFSAEILLSEYRFSGSAFNRFFAEHKKHGWSREISRWPCLTEDLAISLDFGDTPSSPL